MREIANQMQVYSTAEDKSKLNPLSAVKKLFSTTLNNVFRNNTLSSIQNEIQTGTQEQVLFQKVLHPLVSLNECLSATESFNGKDHNNLSNNKARKNRSKKYFALFILLNLSFVPISSYSQNAAIDNKNELKLSYLPQSTNQINTEKPFNKVIDRTKANKIDLNNTQINNEQYIEIDIIQRKLSLKQGNQIIKSYPVGVGNSKEFMTPIGVFAVKQKDAKPGWVHPFKPSIKIPPGPKSPLGTRWISFYEKNGLIFGIHGTNEPESIGKFSSHGCVRMLVKDSEDLFKRVKIGTQIRTIYNRFEIFALETGDIALKVYEDPYQLEPLDLQRIENKVKEKFQDAHINEKAINYLIENNGKNFAENQNHSEQTIVIGYLNSFLQSNNSD
jgi:lipoprotein-anchoring transpeptidase ErfK/SrfK